MREHSAPPHSSPPSATPITIFGAGSIGAHIGTRLAATGASVHLIGRPALAQAVAEAGLHATDLRGQDWRVPPGAVSVATSADGLPDHGLVLVCVKSADTAQAAAQLSPHLGAAHTVVSLQNGIHNAEALRDALPGIRVLGGMVPFNVVGLSASHFHQGSEGQIDVQDDPWWARPDGAQHRRAFERAGLPLRRRDRMADVLWSKLILNLNNPINALSGLPLREELSQRDFRRCLALAQREALTLIAEAGIPLAKIIAIPTAWVPGAISVPDALFRILGRKMLDIDPTARSSMWEDLERGRTTEIDWINGEVVRLADRLGRAAPVNARLVALIRDAELGGRRQWSGSELLAQLK